MHLETSARTGENVEETFLKCARTILSKIESGLMGSRCSLTLQASSTPRRLARASSMVTRRCGSLRIPLWIDPDATAEKSTIFSFLCVVSLPAVALDDFHGIHILAHNPFFKV